jgi:hypothetical protein
MFFVNFGVARMRVVHIVSLSFSKPLVASSVKENSSFYNNVVIGANI